MDLYFITGQRTVQEEEMRRKTVSFLGSAAASLIDLDDLLSSNPKPKQHPVINKPAAQIQAVGKDRKKASLWDEKAIFDIPWSYLWCA